MESRLVIPATAAAIHGVERMRTFARIPRAPLNEGKRANSAYLSLSKLRWYRRRN
jgi:hypothetical protein